MDPTLAGAQHSLLANPYIISAIAIGALFLVTWLFSRFLTTVDAGTIRLVSQFRGGTAIYKGPGKAFEVPLLTTSTTIPSAAINIDLEVADQTADVDRNGQPKPIKVRVLASAIVSVGDSNEMITTAANKFFSKPYAEQKATLSDLLTSTGRRAVNLLSHDELFSSRTQREVDPNALATDIARASGAPRDLSRVGNVPVEEDDRLAIIIKGACSRELQDLGLVFNSLNIKEVQSEVAEARRRQSAVEAKANADIVAADQERRAREAQLTAEQAINDKQRDLEQRRAQNAATIAQAEAEKQKALGLQRQAELEATQLTQANADAARVRIQAEAAADAEAVKIRALGSAQADAEAVKIRALGAAQAEAILAVNDAIRQGGDAYLALKQLEILPLITPAIAGALAQAKLINISGTGEGRGAAAAGAATDQITGVIQTLLATQLVSGQLRLDNNNPNPPVVPQDMNGTQSIPIPPPTIERLPAQAAQPVEQTRYKKA